MIASHVVGRFRRASFLSFIFFLFLSLTIMSAAYAQEPVTGKVSSSTGDPVPGATVQIKGTQLGTATDNSGNFSIVSANPNATLVISSLGFDNFEVPLQGRKTVTVTLTPTTKELDQVVVIGYGTASKRDLTGSIVKIA